MFISFVFVELFYIIYPAFFYREVFCHPISTAVNLDKISNFYSYNLLSYC